MFGLFKKKTTIAEEPTVFFSILLSQNFVQAALWTIDNGLVYIKNKSTLKPYFNEADCLVKLDECLQELGEEGETVTQTIFHLDHSFADEHGIYADKKEFFKNLLASLQLTSIGFVANVEAIVGSKLEEEEGTSHHLIVEFTKNSTLFSLFEGKNLLSSYLAQNTVSLAEQFEAAAAQFQNNVDLPSLEVLNVTLISALLSTEELTTKESSFPEALPLKFSYIGSDIILPVVAVPGATAIAKAKGWLTPEIAAVDTDMAPVATAATVTAATATVAQATATVNNTSTTNHELASLTPDLAPAEKPKKAKKIWPAKPFIIAGIVVGVLAAAVIIFLVILNQTVATVVLQPKTMVLSKTIDITIDPEAAASDYEKLILVGQLETEEISDRVSVPATGTKPVGEKATGRVVLENKKDTERKLSSGTTITTDKGLNFVLKEDVTVAAAKKTENDGKTTFEHSTAEVVVEANEIGEDGNINAGTTLKVAAYNTDDLEAKAKDNFSGGASKDVTVIATSDIAKATKEVTEALKAQAGELSTKEGGKYFTPIVGDLKITQTDLSAEAGEEAQELVLIATATVPMIAYDAADLKPLALAVLEKEVPAGYTMTGEPELMSAVDETQNQTGETLVLQADLSSQATAQIDTNSLQQALLGQELLKADNVIKNDAAIKAYEIKWTNDLYGKIFSKLPSHADKLKLDFYNTSQ